MPKAHAVYEGKAYCSTCYKRVFRPVPCSGCERTVRTPHGVGDALCKGCRVKDRVCLRCGRPTPRAGLLAEGGAVCPSCAPFFRLSRPCTLCGHPSLHLARDRKQGINTPACPACRRKDHRTCSRCGKNRLPAGTRAGGKPLCRACLERGETSYTCPACGKPGRPHSKTHCEDCYWAEVLRKRTEVTCPSLNRAWCRDAVNAFADKMIESGRAKKTAINFEHHLSFIRVLDTHVERASDVTAERLIALFELDGLRRASLLIGALVENGLITNPPLEALREASELQKQQKLLKRCDGAWYHSAIRRFYDFQTERLERYRNRGWVGNLERYRRRSVTLDLKAAKRFFESLPARIGSLHEIQAIHLDTFLYQCRGYRASVGNFITYLRTKERLFHKYKIPCLPACSRLANVLGDLKIDPVIERWLEAPDPQVKYALGAMLMLTYAQPGERIVRLKIGDFKQEPGGNYLVNFTKVALPLDGRIVALMERHLETRPDTAGDYMFPGRRYGAPMSETSLSAYISGFNVTAAELFATGLYRMFASGIRQPQVMVKGLGVSHGTAAAYLEAFDARFIDEALGWMKGKKRPMTLPPAAQ